MVYRLIWHCAGWTTSPPIDMPVCWWIATTTIGRNFGGYDWIAAVECLPTETSVTGPWTS